MRCCKWLRAMVRQAADASHAAHAESERVLGTVTTFACNTAGLNAVIFPQQLSAASPARHLAFAMPSRSYSSMWGRLAGRSVVETTFSAPHSFSIVTAGSRRRVGRPAAAAAAAPATQRSLKAVAAASSSFSLAVWRLKAGGSLDAESVACRMCSCLGFAHASRPSARGARSCKGHNRAEAASFAVAVSPGTGQFGVFVAG